MPRPAPPSVSLSVSLASVSLTALLLLAACGDHRTAAPAAGAPAAPPEEVPPVADPKTGSVEKSEAEWRAALSAEQYHVLREKGTERAFTGKYWDTKTAGTYRCAGCGHELFRSEAKFDSHCGWPSFDRELGRAAIVKTEDRSFGMLRTEVTCPRCGGHLGHLFDDGPTDTGLRYCINSAAVDLAEDAGAKPGK
jgi:peptide-methionine (R)-S-oxide reductase